MVVYLESWTALQRSSTADSHYAEPFHTEPQVHPKNPTRQKQKIKGYPDVSETGVLQNLFSYLNVISHQFPFSSTALLSKRQSLVHGNSLAVSWWHHWPVPFQPASYIESKKKLTIERQIPVNQRMERA